MEDAASLQSSLAGNSEVPLCVDLDRTFIKTDVLVEGVIKLVKTNPLATVWVLYWVIRGKARLKAEVAARTEQDISLLPVNGDLLKWLQAERARGRRLILCTGANERVANEVAAHYGLFEAVVSSNSTSNLSGKAKALALERQYGLHGFDYVGNELKDTYVWDRARHAIVASPTTLLRKRLGQIRNLVNVFDRPTGTIKQWLYAIRAHQWSKNLLIFMPAVASHRLFELPILLTASIAMLWFCLCASGTYIVNDLLDLDADRKHPRKRYRPFAAGEIPLTHGLLAAAFLIVGSIVGGVLTLGLQYAASLAIYLAGTLWYSIALKRIAMVDVLALAGLYTMRVLAGGVATDIIPSFWLLAFSMFMFLNLAIVKRYVELRSLLSGGQAVAIGRGYNTDDLSLLLSCGASAGFTSVLVLALYINGGMPASYRYPQALWLLCPLLLYWILRVWRKAHRDELHDDPVVFALTDKPSLFVAFLGFVLFWIAL
jgi:4-hydroxybenzoate polyprenyltransferase/phosphoserine phosphatase